MGNKNYKESDLEKIIIEAQRKGKAISISLGNNLYFHANKTVGAHYLVRVRIKGGKDTKKPIGDFGKITLKEARKKAADFFKKNQEEKEDQNLLSIVPTVREAYSMYVERKIPKLKKGSGRPSNLRSLFNQTIEPSGIADMPINQITVRLLLDTIVKGPQTLGNRHDSINELRKCLNYHVLQGDIQMNPLEGVNFFPDEKLSKRKRKGYKYIPVEEVKEKFLIPMSKANKLVRAFYLCMFESAFRFGEVRHLRWSWIDFDKEMITIPEDAVGANKTQEIYEKPMSNQLKNLLLNMKKENEGNNSDFVFKSKRSDAPICEASLREPKKAMASDELDPHGIRKIVRTWMSCNGINEVIAELCLQHDVRSTIEKTYNKNKHLEEMKDALQKWADYLDTQLTDEFKELIAS